MPIFTIMLKLVLVISFEESLTSFLYNAPNENKVLNLNRFAVKIHFQPTCVQLSASLSCCLGIKPSNIPFIQICISVTKLFLMLSCWFYICLFITCLQKVTFTIFVLCIWLCWRLINQTWRTVQFSQEPVVFASGSGAMKNLYVYLMVFLYWDTEVVMLFILEFCSQTQKFLYYERQ